MHWLSDDRCVEPDDELSNFKMIKTTLLDRLTAAGVEVEFCRRILGERGYEQGAIEYERELEHVGGGPGAIRFELVLIGVGSDGHICSMFPGQESLSERSRLAVGVPVAGLEPFVPRVTLTFPALSRAKRVLVLATGAGKADPIAADVRTVLRATANRLRAEEIPVQSKMMAVADIYDALTASDRPYKKAVPLDPWGHPYVYASPGTHNNDIDLMSYGKDGRPGGTGESADLTNW